MSSFCNSLNDPIESATNLMSRQADRPWRFTLSECSSAINKPRNLFLFSSCCLIFHGSLSPFHPPRGIQSSSCATTRSGKLEGSYYILVHSQKIQSFQAPNASEIICSVLPQCFSPGDLQREGTEMHEVKALRGTSWCEYRGRNY